MSGSESGFKMGVKVRFRDMIGVMFGGRGRGRDWDLGFRMGVRVDVGFQKGVGVELRGQGRGPGFRRGSGLSFEVRVGVQVSERGAGRVSGWGLGLSFGVRVGVRFRDEIGIRCRNPPRPPSRNPTPATVQKLYPDPLKPNSNLETQTRSRPRPKTQLSFRNLTPIRIPKPNPDRHPES
ncbi:hypothetical protein TIFTF001_012809 [Ficus carica]|uniref:Uncharacterized protein n=1 Tax=Ficus carica TaxID=3494 RepID=A0AA88D6L3_FICCA|nr:hypothetical protein TIFTF001_012809 [Ficus carica]